MRWFVLPTTLARTRRAPESSIVTYVYARVLLAYVHAPHSTGRSARQFNTSILTNKPEHRM